MAKYFEDLIVWQKAMDLVIEVYRLIRFLPKEETYALADQLRRSAVSIPSNIAEGQQRGSRQEMIRFSAIARGSAGELQTQLLLCERLSYITKEQMATALDLTKQVNKMLTALITNLTR